MLQVLRITNLAVIEELTWELEQGFNILTGETGAGKSILIDALGLLLGAKADKSMIRHGAEQCSVEAALYGLEQVDSLLQELGLDPLDDGELILRRVFSHTGPSKQFINGSPTTLQVLKQLGHLLVDMHGPHDHQSLLSRDEQLKALDAFAGLEELVAKFRLEFRALQDIRAELESLTSMEGTDWRQQLEFLEFQINEIETARLSDSDEYELERDYKVAHNTQRITEIGGGVQRLLGDAEPDVLSLLSTVQRSLQEWQELDDSADYLSELNEGAIAQLRELQGEVEALLARSELDGERLTELEARMNLVQSLKKKYGSNVPGILETLQGLQLKRDGLANREHEIARLQKHIDEKEIALLKQAKDFSKKRAKSLERLGRDITKELQALGFQKADFYGDLLSGQELRSEGLDTVEFQFAPNLGEVARPLRVIASSGEMARVMLAVKTVLAKQDKVPILIFDEVDANVGGETAVAVAKKLRGLASSHQVLCITHLPQVAAAGHKHFNVVKEVKAKRTRTQLEVLEGAKRLEEIARMLGGKNDSALAMAESLLQDHKHVASA
ncbi:MAG: DNA repair protein RecN [Verrucomicrobiota bacterium]